MLAFLPLVFLLPLLLGVTMARWINKFDDLLISKVASDLRVAEQYFAQIEEANAAKIAALAQSARFATALSNGPAALDDLMQHEQKLLDLDFLLYHTGNDSDFPTPALPVITHVKPNTSTAALALFDGEELYRLSPDLAQKAAISLVPTEAARTIDRRVETRGMVLVTAYRSADGASVLLSGQLLNRNLSVIDSINDLIYREATESQMRTGTTTLFLDDVRISTNVRLFAGERALGTRVSEIVWEQVMNRGEPWLDRAFVVNDWYISGYVPLSDIQGARIGMLYTGFLEAPFSAQRNATVLILFISFVTVLGVSTPIFLRLARGIFAPLEKMTDIMEQAEAGVLDARIGHIGARDEIGTVAGHLDRLLDQVQERDEALRSYAESLNEQVDNRTQELQETNKKLEATFAKLILVEKLSSLGEITAGVAHEINNPVAVIQGNLEVLRAALPQDIEDEVKTELQLIDAQTHRINIIVSKLLNFTRPNELSEVPTSVDVAQAVEDALILVTADLRKSSITTQVQHSTAPKIMVVETELAQVLVNLMINAGQAMPGGGQLTITTHAEDSEGCPGTVVCLSDTGKGIAKGQIKQIFDPFFSTKPGEGTGLGLSISQALISRAGGFISVRSTEGQGAEFFVWCPAADNLSSN